MNPLDNPEAYDVFFLSNQISPGLCDIQGLGSPRAWDERDGNAQSGATLAFKGNKLAHFKALITLTETEDFDAWDRFTPLLEKTPAGQKPKAQDFYHAQASVKPWDIRSVVIEDVGQLKQAADGLWQVEISLGEYNEAKAASGVPTKSDQWTQDKSSGDAADRQIDDLTKQAKALG